MKGMVEVYSKVAVNANICHESRGRGYTKVAANAMQSIAIIRRGRSDSLKWQQMQPVAIMRRGRG